MNASEPQQTDLVTPARERVAAYLDAVGVTLPIRDRIGTLRAFYEKFVDDEIKTIALNELPDSGESRVYESVWFFTSKYAMEARFRESGVEEQLDIVPMAGRLMYVQIGSVDYDFSEAQAGSRLRVQLWFPDARYGEIRASGPNCDAVLSVVRDTLLPNLVGRVPL